jgi:Xaa-Pro aminopeptidase
MKAADAKLIIASSHASADLLYATRFFVPDDIIWIGTGRKTHAVFSPLEIDRARVSARVGRIYAWDRLEAEWKKAHPEEGKPGLAAMAVFLLRKLGIAKVEVPGSFPLLYAEFLRRSGIAVVPCGGLFFPAREIKSAWEVACITRAQRQAEAGMRRGWEVLRASRAGRDGRLRWAGGLLTSERLRAEIDSAVLRAGGTPADTIVAGGVQACDPHERGSGPLRKGETIILDIFPRDAASGYYGDLTRTVVKGGASEAVRRLYHTVLAGQKKALGAMRAGADGNALHRSLQEDFTAAGYPTCRRKGRWVGFFHGTGHCLGLELHEPPRFAAGPLKAGHVMTVEPGLYDPEIGGVRIEDLVWVRARGIQNLTRIPKVLEIP